MGAELDPDTRKILERTGIRLEDAIAYAEERHGNLWPNIKDNPSICVKLYLHSRGQSESDILAENYAKVVAMKKSGSRYKVQLLIADMNSEWQYPGCTVCGKRLKGDIGDSTTCDSKRCNGASRLIQSHTMREYWAGDDTGSVKLIVRADKIREEVIGGVVIVDGTFNQGREPVIFVDSIRIKKAPAKEEPTLTESVVQAQPRREASPTPAPDKVEGIKRRIQTYMRLFEWQIELAKFEKWFGENFPGVDYEMVKRQLPMTAEDQGGTRYMVWRGERI